MHLSAEAFVSLYKALVRCHQEHENTVWNPRIIGLININMRATKYSNCNKAPQVQKTNEDFRDSVNLPTLPLRRIREDLFAVYKILTVT